MVLFSLMHSPLRVFMKFMWSHTALRPSIARHARGPEMSQTRPLFREIAGKPVIVQTEANLQLCSEPQDVMEGLMRGLT